ncbi:MAG: hypothetical protein Q4A78_13195 [Peptostreptococcaceae bacterium]|nr:hypothetical protein [Peptostreptococcaceae bacterium]
MKLFSSKKKLAVTATLIATLAAGSFAYAATAVKQDAYYGTFRFLVNGNEQMISDPALRPFIANNRVYVPIGTLNNLGIANAQWTGASGGAQAVLNVTPKGSSVDPAQITGLQTQISNLTATVSAKDAEILKVNNELKTITEENKKLKEELEKLKSSSSSSSSTTLTDAKVRNLNDSYRHNLYRRYLDLRYQDKISNDTYKQERIDLEFDAQASAYRDQLDIEVTARRFDQDKWNKYLAYNNRDERDLARFIEDEVIKPATSEFKDIRDLRINIVVYNGDRRNGTRIATGTYDRGRLSLRLD